MWAWVAHCFKNYMMFEGRASRPEYWWFHLFTSLCNVAIYILTLEATSLGFPLRFLYGGAHRLAVLGSSLPALA
jgi:uncharacterized membrane protein YhaH (DUF805 family)